jgi:lipopolysaccharide export system protein LptA
MEKANDSTYNGQVYFMKGTDTIHTEKILLQQVEDSYNTTIKGQNDEPVSFILTDRNETQLVLKIESITIQKNQLHADFKRQSGD